jgi:hypothetical protein
MAAPAIGPGGPTLVHARVNLRYQYHDINHGDEVILATLSNHANGNTVGVFKIEPNQHYLKLIGTVNKYHVERINDTARPQRAPRFKSLQRGGARVGSGWTPDISMARISPAWSQELHGFPPDYGRDNINIILDVYCRT